MSSLTNLRLTNCTEFAAAIPHNLNSFSLSTSLSFPATFTFNSLGRIPSLTTSFSMDAPVSSKVKAASTIGTLSLSLSLSSFLSPKIRISLNLVKSSYSNFLCPEKNFMEPITSVFLGAVSSVCLFTFLLAGAPNNELEASAAGSVGASDLLIVGPGVLGRIIAEKWREEHPGSQIYGQTLTSNHHEELIKMGITPSLKGTLVTQKFPYVIFCAPPYGNPDYPGEVKEATLNWNGEGCFLFTSSSAPYDCSDNGYCDEGTPDVPIGKSPRTDNLLNSEKVVLEAGGCVVRLAGLYISFPNRGAHTYWLEKGISEVRPDHILNLIHYEDAASLSITILKKNLRGRTFLGCDNHSLSRQEIMELVNRSGKYSKKFEAFTGTSDPLGKKLNNSKTRAELGWEPKYPSFAQFLETL
ncbi:Rossmann-fold superfamily protein [Perilla frutescens var. hirtella]|nr:Rossmann-fold superfamily protein [Perilla frutescens var. hirtella]